MQKGLPKFEADKLYIFSGSTINQLIAALEVNRPCCTDNGGIVLISQSDDGAFLGKGGGGGKTENPADSLPKFDDAKFYVLTDSTVEQLFRLAKRDLTKACEGSGLSAEYGSDGVLVSYRSA